MRTRQQIIEGEQPSLFSVADLIVGDVQQTVAEKNAAANAVVAAQAADRPRQKTRRAKTVARKASSDPRNSPHAVTSAEDLANKYNEGGGRKRGAQAARTTVSSSGKVKWPADAPPKTRAKPTKGQRAASSAQAKMRKKKSG